MGKMINSVVDLFSRHVLGDKQLEVGNELLRNQVKTED